VKEVYESVIEIWIDKPKNLEKKEEILRREAKHIFTLRNRYLEGTQRFEMANLMYHLVHNQISSGRTGYVGAYHNCDFPTLYRVFGGDPIAFLFNQPWVPHTVFDPFKSEDFLNQLFRLELAAENLREGDKLPIPEFALSSSQMVGEAGRFSDSDQWFLIQSLRELRDFGEFGLGLQKERHSSRAEIHIFIPDGKCIDEIMVCARRLHPLTEQVTEHAIGHAIYAALEKHLETVKEEDPGSPRCEVVSIDPAPNQVEQARARLSSEGRTVDQFRTELSVYSIESNSLCASRVRREYVLSIWVDDVNNIVNAAVMQDTSWPGQVRVI
jgi:hypothetical protein